MDQRRISLRAQATHLLRLRFRRICKEVAELSEPWGS